MGHRDNCPLDLTISALAAELLGRLDHKNIPNMPGCVYDRPPPLVFIAEPPGPCAPCGERTALALRAEAEILEVEERVMVNES